MSLNLAQHALRVAVLSVRKARVAAEEAAARAEAQEAFRLARQAGISQLKPRLPGGVEAGSLSIKKGATVVTFVEDSLLEVVEASTPECVEDYIDPTALTDRRVLDLLREHLPEFTGRRVMAARKSELHEEVIPTGGFLANLKTGERVQVAKVETLDPTGEYAYTPGKPGTVAIVAALMAGDVTPDGYGIAGAAG